MCSFREHFIYFIFYPSQLNIVFIISNLPKGHGIQELHAYFFTISIQNIIYQNELKGYVSVASSDPPCEDVNARSKTITLKLCPIKHELDINVYHFENRFFHNLASQQKRLVHLNCMITFRNYQKCALLNLEPQHLKLRYNTFNPNILFIIYLSTYGRQILQIKC